ncbi:MAG: class II aldolase/adducin family protein [Deltaproteobacteria bacterium]|nr:class II aldolase/adducin family protein [Deltaproteobacteria bacterium]
MQGEGVIQFVAEHEQKPIPERRFGELARTLIAWREILARTNLVGQDPLRYEGAGYGNLSGRVGAPTAPRGQRGFLVTGTQTSGAAHVSLRELCWVRAYDYGNNRVESEGEIHPSSESLTHGAIYDLAPHIRFVMHAHAPVVWQRAKALRLPMSVREAANGTVAMAREVQRLYCESALAERQIFAMGGHEDGVIVFGRSVDEAGTVLITTLARAYELGPL